MLNGPPTHLLYDYKMPTHGEMINEVSRELPEPFTKKQLTDAIIEKYGNIRSIDPNSLGTDISGCCVNLKTHYHLPNLPLILVSLGGGLYRRYNPRTDKKLNIYLEQDSQEPKITKSTKKSLEQIKSLSTKANYYEYNGSKAVLERKGLMEEIKQIVKDIKRVDHNHIQGLFANRGWDIEYPIHPAVSWAWDAYKNQVPVSIELSLIDAVHRDLLRLLLWEYENKVDAMVYLTSTSKEPKFKNVKRDLDIFKPILKVPLLLIGLSG
jgi:cytochrome c-type biogenesis protein CcmH/NrfF